MPDYLVDLIAWTIAFIVFFFGFKYLQNRKNNKKDD